MLFFLWGVFRGRKINHSDSAKKICIPSIDLMPVKKDFPTAVMTLSETHCSSMRMDEESTACDRTCSMVLPSTSLDQGHVTVSKNSDVKETYLDQTHLASEVNLDGQDSSRLDAKLTSRIPASGASTGSSLVMFIPLNA